jgi:hypothetical protein
LSIIYAPHCRVSGVRRAPQRILAAAAAILVFVVGHSNTVPPLLKALGCVEDIEIPAAQYDDLFAVVPTAHGPPTLLRLTY